MFAKFSEKPLFFSDSDLSLVYNFSCAPTSSGLLVALCIFFFSPLHLIQLQTHNTLSFGCSNSLLQQRARVYFREKTEHQYRVSRGSRARSLSPNFTCTYHNTAITPRSPTTTSRSSAACLGIPNSSSTLTSSPPENHQNIQLTREAALR